MSKIKPLSSRTLGSFSVWAIGVGLVISGESFGWNNGWRHMGPLGFMLPVLLVTLLYYALIKCYIELACVYPNAHGPHSYAKLAFGKPVGKLVAFATLVEFLFASPAIANTIGEYLHYLSPESLDVKWIATFFLLFFCVINLFRIEISTLFVIFLTLLAIIELGIYFFSVSPEFHTANITFIPSNTYDFSSLIKAMPFAIWLYLGIEGISLVTRHVKTDNFRKHISDGYIYTFLTLLVLIILVLLFSAGSSSWIPETWLAMISESNGHPLPFSMEISLGKSNRLVQAFTFLGLFGLIASLQGIIMASMKQVQSLFADHKHNLMSSLIVFTIGIVSIWLQKTSFLIELSVFGAVCMYLFSGLSLLKLKRTNYTGPEYKVPEIDYSHSDFSKWKTYTWAAIVILLSLFCMSSLTIIHTGYFFIFMCCALVYVLLSRQHH